MSVHSFDSFSNPCIHLQFVKLHVYKLQRNTVVNMLALSPYKCTYVVKNLTA